MNTTMPRQSGNSFRGRTGFFKIVGFAGKRFLSSFQTCSQPYGNACYAGYLYSSFILEKYNESSNVDVCSAATFFTWCLFQASSSKVFLVRVLVSHWSEYNHRLLNQSCECQNLIRIELIESVFHKVDFKKGGLEGHKTIINKMRNTKVVFVLISKNLTWRDVQHIIIRSSRADGRILQAKDWTTNAANLTGESLLTILTPKIGDGRVIAISEVPRPSLLAEAHFPLHSLS